MRSCLAFGLLFISGLQLCSAQTKVERPSFSQSVPLIELKLDGEAKHTDVRLAGIAGEIKCESGAAYFRTIQPDRDLYANPVFRVKDDGTSVQFSPSNIPDAKDAELIAFDVNPEGALFAVVREFKGKRPLHFLVQFSASGNFASRNQLVTELEPVSIALLPQNEILVELSNSSSGAEAKRVTAVFNESGQIVRVLALETDSRDAPSRIAGSGGARIGQDGHIYQFSGGTSPTLIAYDAVGKRLRTLKVETPFRGAAAMDMHLGTQRLLVIFQSEESLQGKGGFEMVYSLYDIATGKRIADYSKLPGPIACFTDDEITILKPTKDGYFAIGKASLK